MCIRPSIMGRTDSRNFLQREITTRQIIVPGHSQLFRTPTVLSGSTYIVPAIATFRHRRHIRGLAQSRRKNMESHDDKYYQFLQVHTQTTVLPEKRNSFKILSEEKVNSYRLLDISVSYLFQATPRIRKICYTVNNFWLFKNLPKVGRLFKSQVSCYDT